MKEDKYYTAMVYVGSDGSRVRLHPTWNATGKDASEWQYSFPPKRIKYYGGKTKMQALNLAANHKGLSGKDMNWEPQS